MGIGKLVDGLAPTPPMGWNSWNRFERNIDERLIRETAEAIVEHGLRRAGYRYVVIDDCWEAPRRDADGDLVADPDRFPHGIKALADHVHGLGLRFGIYTDAGTQTCAGNPGSLGYEFRDARTFAAWGADFVKIDWCHTDGLGPRALYGKWAHALAAARRPMVLSICEWGRSRPWEWAPVVGHMWRTSGDIKDTWASLMAIADRQADLHPYAGPDRWNDPDMLEVGNGGMSDTEYRTHVSLWAMLAAPLIAGNDLREMRPGIRDLLTAPEVVALDQDPHGRQGRRARREGEREVWTRGLADGSRAVLLLNRGERDAEVGVTWEELGLTARTRATVRDLWERHDLPPARSELSARVEPHGAVLLRLGAEPV